MARLRKNGKLVARVDGWMRVQPYKSDSFMGKWVILAGWIKSINQIPKKTKGVRVFFFDAKTKEIISNVRAKVVSRKTVENYILA